MLLMMMYFLQGLLFPYNLHNHYVYISLHLMTNHLTNRIVVKRRLAIIAHLI